MENAHPQPNPPQHLLAREQDLHANAALITILTQPPESTCAPSTYTLLPSPTADAEIHAANALPTAHRHPNPNPLSPVPLPGLTPAITTWLRARNIPPTTLPTAHALCLTLLPRTPRTLRRRVNLFTRAAIALGIPPADLPTEPDIRLHRAWPRVLHAVAAVAARIDPDGWAAACAAHLPAPLPFGWRDCALDEAWDGDDVARAMLAANPARDCTVLVAGSQGAGKSALVGRLLGRVALSQSHALSFVPAARSEKEESENSKLQHVTAVSWPRQWLEMDVPVASRRVDRAYVKVDGGVLQFVELPSMESELESVDPLGLRVEMEHGCFEEVVAEVQLDCADYALVVERLDELCPRRLRGAIRKLQRVYGKHVLDRAIVVLTHGQSLPPGDMSYEVWLFDRLRVVREVVNRIERDRNARPIPIVVVENSENCARDSETGRPVLPDGTDFLSRFVEEFRLLARRASSSAVLTPIPTKRWWEDYVVMAGIALLVIRLF